MARSHTCGLSSCGGCSPRITCTTISAASLALADQTPWVLAALCGVRTTTAMVKEHLPPRHGGQSGLVALDNHGKGATSENDGVAEFDIIVADGQQDDHRCRTGELGIGPWPPGQPARRNVTGAEERSTAGGYWVLR